MINNYRSKHAKKYLLVACLLPACFLSLGCQHTDAQNREMEQSQVIINVADYGALADGQTLNTTAFQAAIDATPIGGVLLVEPGQYVIGTIELKSDMELRIAEGAELLGSQSIDDYRRDIEGAIEGPAFDEVLIYAEDVENLKITGGGTINGRGHREVFPVKLDDGTLGDRPMLIRFVNSKGITLEGITLKDAASWCTHMVDCDDITIRGVTVHSHVNTNNDGFDLDGCKDILIEDCDIYTGDDSICPKSTTTRLTENMLVRNCLITSNTAAFKCGTSSRGGFKNITIQDCEFIDSRMGAIKLLVVDGGTMEDILIENIVMKNVEGPLFIRLGDRGRSYAKPTEQVYKEKAESEGIPTGSIKNITLRNIKAEVVSDVSKRCGIMMTGVPGHYIENVLLENIEISYPGGGTAEDAKREIAEDAARYPEQFFFGVLPSWGAYLRHVKNVEFKNVKMSTRAADARPEIVEVDVINFSRK